MDISPVNRRDAYCIGAGFKTALSENQRRANTRFAPTGIKGKGGFGHDVWVAGERKLKSTTLNSK